MFGWLKRLVGGRAEGERASVHIEGPSSETLDEEKTARLQKEAIPGAVPPVGAWVELKLPWEKPEPFIGFTYVDPDAGLSAKGGPDGAEKLVQAPEFTVRLPLPLPFRVLSEEEKQRRGLPVAPPWLHFFGRQPDPDAPWRKDARLSPLLLPRFPDDLAVHFFGFADGEWHREEMWVRVHAFDAKTGLYEGQLLNQPHHLRRVSKGDPVRFRPTHGIPQPVYVGDVEAANLEEYDARCEGCGFDVLLEPAREIQARQFPNAPADEAMLAFTTRCPLCGGAMLVNRRDAMDLA